jgi:hypothetical protein
VIGSNDGFLRSVLTMKSTSFGEAKVDDRAGGDARPVHGGGFARPRPVELDHEGAFLCLCRRELRASSPSSRLDAA